MGQMLADWIAHRTMPALGTAGFGDLTPDLTDYKTATLLIEPKTLKLLAPTVEPLAGRIKKLRLYSATAASTFDLTITDQNDATLCTFRAGQVCAADFVYEPGDKWRLTMHNLGVIAAASTPINLTGARDVPEQALRDLITAIEDVGIITDNTTAS